LKRKRIFFKKKAWPHTHRSDGVLGRRDPRLELGACIRNGAGLLSGRARRDLRGIGTSSDRGDLGPERARHVALDGVEQLGAELGAELVAGFAAERTDLCAQIKHLGGDPFKIHNAQILDRARRGGQASEGCKKECEIIF
jgi:hypothetical protein